MAKAKYGIKVPFDNSYIWISQLGESFDSKPELFDSEESAVSAAKIWGPLAQIEKYPVDNQE